MPAVTPSRDAPGSRPARSALAEWRAFASSRYRAFHVIGAAQGIVTNVAGTALAIPLVLALGTPPAVATIIGILPLAGGMAQLGIPGLLRRTEGNLQGLTLLAIVAGETRGLWLAFIATLAGLHVLPDGIAVAAIALVLGIGGAFGSVATSNLLAWYHVVLTEEERRFVAPRVVGVAVGLGAILLLPIALLIDAAARAYGPGAYAPPFLLAGLAGFLELGGAASLPHPGRVRVPRLADAPVSDPVKLRRFGRIAAFASFGSGLGPFLSIYVISVLHLSAGFAIVLSAVSAGASLAASIIVGGLLHRHSASRILRVAYLLRGGSMLLGLTALPGTPWAAPVLVAVAAIVTAGASADQLSSNERLFRLVAGPSAIAHQGRFVARNGAAVTVGQLVSASVMAVGPVAYSTFAILFASSGLARVLAAMRIDVSATWLSGTGVWTAGELGPTGDAGPPPGEAGGSHVGPPRSDTGSVKDGW